MQKIPTYLETPPRSRINPPTQSRAQELPFDELSWEDFEKLCLRLARQETSVETCRLYGVRGDAQEGIDIYARRRLEEGYRVYQCKRVEAFSPEKIRDAVTTFISGEWAVKSKFFYLCTQEDLRSRLRSDAIEEQRKILDGKGIQFVVWDGHELSLVLKDHPKLVDDFFGRNWVSEFCGEDVAEQLGNRLDNSQVGEFRDKLGSFYRRIFNIHDPGLPGAYELDSLPLENRFVIPDITEEVFTDISVSNEKGINDGMSRIAATQATRSEQTPYESDQGRNSVRTISHRQRLLAEEWLTSDERHIILGGPGSGKSSLLRFIAIDLLDHSPRLAHLASKRGEYLPVWISFAYWTKKIAHFSTGSCSLTEGLHDWFKSLNEERLWPLIERALEDERLLLLVDGLDEWASENSAQIALDRLQVFIEQRGIPAIFSSRPHGFTRLGFRHSGYRIGELADFDNRQQRELARHWFRNQEMHLRRGSLLDEEDLRRTVEHDLDSFFGEMQRAKDIHDLAKVPLLLCLLIVLKFQNARLPQSRFKAYEQLIDHLVSTHPRRRITAAGLSDSVMPVEDEDIKKALAYLALQMHLHHPEGIVDLDTSKKILEEYLRDDERGLGLTAREAQQCSRQVIDASEQALGIIVERSPYEVGFYHRAFQEFLAAICVYRMPIEEQLQLISEKCGNTQWRESLLALCHINSRSEDVRKYVEHIDKASLPPVEHSQRELLLAEIAFGDSNCPAKLSRELAESTFLKIQYGDWMPQREKLLTHVLGGLSSSKVKEAVKSQLRRWFPGLRQWVRASVFEAMATWTRNSEIRECLWAGLFDEHNNVQRAAAKSLATLFAGDVDVGNRLYELARITVDPIVRAAALESLLSGWSKYESLPDLLKNAKCSGNAELQLTAIKGFIVFDKQTKDDLIDLLELGEERGSIGYEWRDDVVNALISGWPGCAEVKEKCLKAVKHQMYSEDNLEREIALKVLIQGYPSDDEVAKYFASAIQEEHRHFFLLNELEFWDLLRKNFKDHPILVNALDAWMPQQEAKFNEHYVSFAALLGRTSIGKEVLLKMLKENRNSNWPISALLEGWGMSDPEVAATLNALAVGSDAIASTIGSYLPKIITEPIACKTRLMTLLRSPLCQRYDAVLAGLIEIDGHKEPDVLDLILSKLSNQEVKGLFYDNIVSQLISNFPSDPRVREIAREQLFVRDGNIDAVARAFGNDDEFGTVLKAKVNPLPANLRILMCNYLGEAYGEEEFILGLLREYDDERDEEAKTCASISYHKRLKDSASDTNQAINYLSETIVCVGYDYEARRQAAMCGLLMLDRLDVWATKITPGDSERGIIPFGHWEIRSNTTWFRLVAKYFSKLQTVVGQDQNRVFRENDSEMWYSLINYAHEYDDVSNAALSYLDQNPEICSPGVLRFISKVQPKSQLLLERCLKSLNKNDSHSNDDFIAPEIVGSSFGGDKDVLNKLLSMRSYQNEERLIVALCEGWYDCKELDDIFELAKKNQTPMTYIAFFQLICLKSDSPVIYDRLIEIISDGRRWSRQVVIRPISRRLKADENLVRLLCGKLLDNPNPSEKASIPRLIDASVGLSVEIRDWCEKEVRIQLEGSQSPEIGFDIITGEKRPIVHSLFDILS